MRKVKTVIAQAVRDQGQVVVRLQCVQGEEPFEDHMEASEFTGEL